jgi:hypothetical protein
MDRGVCVGTKQKKQKEKQKKWIKIYLLERRVLCLNTFTKGLHLEEKGMKEN